MPPTTNPHGIVPPLTPPIQTPDVEEVSTLLTYWVATGGSVFHYFPRKICIYAKVVNKRATRCHLPPSYAERAEEVNR